ncbi:MAG: cytochrome c biogenesis protein ResB [bacterium]
MSAKTSLSQPNPTSSNRQGFRQIWDLLHSMKFAIWILVLTGSLALAILVLGEYIPEKVRESSILRILGVSDPFRSWWFRAVLGALSLSLLVCIIERTPIQLRLAFQHIFRTHPSQFLGMSDLYYQVFSPTTRNVPVEEILKRLVRRTEKKTGENWIAWAGWHGGISRLGPLLSHLGFLIIIVGGLLISLTSYATRVQIAPGDSITLPEWGFALKLDTFRIEFYPPGLNMWVKTPEEKVGKVINLKGDSALVAFSLRSKETFSKWFPKRILTTEFEIFQGGKSFPFQGNISSYISEVRLLEGEKDTPYSIKVNHPLRHKGFRFYQSSFEPLPSQIRVDSLILICSHRSGEQTEIIISTLGEAYPLPWEDLSVEWIRFFPDFRLDEQMRPFSVSEEIRNPVAQLVIRRSGDILGKTYAFWGMVGHMGAQELPVQFGIKELRGPLRKSKVYATILEVRREAGREFIWLGLGITTIGLLLLYTFSHRQVWALELIQPDGKREIYITGTDHRQPALFRQELSQVATSFGFYLNKEFNRAKI